MSKFGNRKKKRSPKKSEADNVDGYVMERLQSAMGAALNHSSEFNTANFDLSNPNMEGMSELVNQFDLSVNSSLNTSRDSLLENVEVRHLAKTLFSYGSMSAQASNPDEDSPVGLLPKTLDKIVKILDIDKLESQDPSTIWWTYHIGNISVPWSNVDEEFCRVFVNETFYLLEWWRQVLTSKLLLKNPNGDRKVTQLIEAYLGNLHNMARFGSCRSKFVDMKFIDVAENYLTSSEEVSQCLALMFTAGIAKDSESSRLSDKYGIIPSMTKFLKLTLDGDSSQGFSVDELAEGCNLLMVRDENKQKFVQAGIMPLIDQLLQSSNEKEQDRGIDCLWTLAFGENERQRILKSKSTISKLTRLAESKTKAANALQFIQNGRENLGKLKDKSKPTKADIGASFRFRQVRVPEKTEKKEEKSQDEHIFISYSWKQQATCVKMKQFLTDKKFKVWMDIDAMHGSTLEAMALAIEKAMVILVCYSDDYKQSPNCRTEAEYLFQLKKPFVPVSMQHGFQPDGWLGIIIGSRSFVDMTLLKFQFNDATRILMNEINRILGIGETAQESNIAKVNPTPVALQTMPNSTEINSGKIDSSALKISLLKAKVSSWKKEDVEKWLKDEKFSENTKIVKLLKNFDGNNLVSIFEMKNLAAEIYYTTMLKNLGNDFINVLKFSDAMERLCI